MRTPFHGIFTPLVTPLDPDEAPDLHSLRRLVEVQVRQGVHGFWAMGTSGEFASFDEDERAAAIEVTVEAAAGKPVIANISTAATRSTIRNGKRAVHAGATAVAATPPFYYPNSQEEVLAHYRDIRQAVDLPLFIYNIPQTVRTRVEFSTARTLIAEGTVAGIKDSQNDLEYFRQLTLFARQQALDFAAFAGTRHLIDAAILAGGQGAIPSLANAFPDLAVATYEAAVRGDWAEAQRTQTLIVELEGIPGLLQGRSKNAATLGFLKSLLAARGTIARATLTAPLISPSREEQQLVVQRAEAITAVA